jgi:hypothetical protein
MVFAELYHGQTGGIIRRDSMNIRSGPGATIGPLYLPEIEEAAR